MSKPSRIEHTQACDSCRRRKIRCDQLEPCAKCQSAGINCTYVEKVKRKTPVRRVTVSVIPSLSNYRDISAGPRPVVPSIAGLDPYSPAIAVSPLNTTWQDDQQVPATSDGLRSSTTLKSAEPCRLAGSLLRMHVKLFLRWMFPLWPILSPNDLLEACNEVDILPPVKYCLLLSICAATNIQLKLSSNHSLADLAEPNDVSDEVIAPYTQQYLLNESVKVRNNLNSAEELDIDALLTSMFLFSAFANTLQHQQARFYLSQTVTYCVALRLNDESSYAVYSIVGRELNCRIFWLVYILERAWCLHNIQPVVLASITLKPCLTFADDPGPVDSFLTILSIFEALPASLYNWLCTPQTEQAQDVDLIPIAYWRLSEVSLFPEGALQSQLVNISITQHWLRTFLWQIALSLKLRKSTVEVQPLPLEAPLSAARSVMTTVALVSQRSTEVHGIGMERKLFDVGTYILDFISACPNAIRASSAIATDSKELLWGIMLSLSKVREPNPALLSSLLRRSSDFLALACLHSPMGIPADAYHSRSEDRMIESIPSSTAGGLTSSSEFVG